VDAAIDWQRVVGATLHPTQVEILAAAASCNRLSPMEFCDNKTAVSGVAYHFGALHRAGLLAAAGTTPRRGATEHFYRLARSARGS
jgi:hypothetical protein